VLPGACRRVRAHMSTYDYGAYYSQYQQQQYAQQPPQQQPPPPIGADQASELGSLRAENASLRQENAALRAEIAQLKSSGGPPAMVPPPQFYPPYGMAPPPGYPYGPQGGAQAAAPPRPNNPPLAINADNRRGPKGANLALFCIPNAYYDQGVFDLCKPYGNVVFCSVATHRDTGLSRGYAFVSYETVEEAQVATSALHNMVLDGRALRCELARSDKDAPAKPY